MTLHERVAEAVKDGYKDNLKDLLVDLYHQVFPLKDRLSKNCSACGTTAYNKLLYFYNTQIKNQNGTIKQVQTEEPS